MKKTLRGEQWKYVAFDLQLLPSCTIPSLLNMKGRRGQSKPESHPLLCWMRLAGFWGAIAFSVAKRKDQGHHHPKVTVLAKVNKWIHACTYITAVYVGKGKNLESLTICYLTRLVANNPDTFKKKRRWLLLRGLTNMPRKVSEGVKSVIISKDFNTATINTLTEQKRPCLKNCRRISWA